MLFQCTKGTLLCVIIFVFKLYLEIYWYTSCNFILGSTPPSHDHLPNHDQLLAKQLEKQERERMKQKEQEDFQKLQAVYGMDNKGNYNQQTMTNLQEAVSSGQLSVYDYYEKIYEIKMAESKGLDTGASATRGMFLILKIFRSVHR